MYPRGRSPNWGNRIRTKHELSFSALVDATIVVGKSENGSTDGRGIPGVSEIGMSPRNGEDQDCPEVNIVERKKPQLRGDPLLLFLMMVLLRQTNLEMFAQMGMMMLKLV